MNICDTLENSAINCSVWNLKTLLRWTIPVLCGAIQNKAIYQNHNGLKITWLKLLQETLIIFMSEVLIYYIDSIVHQLKK